MTIIANPHDSGSFIISDAKHWRSRDRVTLAGNGSWIQFGTVLGVNSTGQYVPSPATATDGSDVACAILFEDTDTTNDVVAGVVARDAEVFAGALTFDPSVNTSALQEMKWAQLASVGIIVREQDDPEARAANLIRISYGW